MPAPAQITALRPICLQMLPHIKNAASVTQTKAAPEGPAPQQLPRRS